LLSDATLEVLPQRAGV